MHQMSNHENFNSVQSMSNILPIREKMAQNVLIPGAKVVRQPIIPNIQRYDEAVIASGRTQIKNQLNNMSISQKSSNHGLVTMNSVPVGNMNAMHMSHNQSPTNQQSVPGLPNKENMTFRGQLESLEAVLIDVGSEIKYHRRQIEIIKAEKDTTGAVVQMNIVNTKNTLLNEEYKMCEEIKRANRKQDREFEKLHNQVDVLDNETYTANTRLMQMQRRILEVEQIVGLPPKKLA